MPGRKPVRGLLTRVVAFRELPHSANSPGKLAADLRQAIKKRRSLSRNVSVVVWGLKANHQVILVPPAMPSELEGLVRREAGGAGGPAGVRAKGAAADARRGPTVARSAAGAPKPAAKPNVFVDGFVAGEVREGGKQEIGYVSSTLEDVHSRLKPLVDAGFEIHTLLTPALSHAAIIRQRRINSPDAVAAVVSFNSHVTAITVLRGQIVLFTRELPWGWEPDRPGAAGVPGDTSTVAERLAAELKRSFVFVKQQRQVDVGQVLVCGDMPALRDLTGPLMQELNVEVEILDSLEGLDGANLPAPAEEFQAAIARLRPACAVAAEAEPPINLMPRSQGLAIAVAKSTQRSLAVACAASIVLTGAVWAAGNSLMESARADAQALRQQIGRLEPETQRAQRLQQAATTRSLRLAALEAFTTQGPRLALALDAFRQAPSDLAASKLTLTTALNGTWALDVSGQAKSRTTADAQAAFSTFLRAAGASKYLGLPSRPPVIRTHLEEAPPAERKEPKSSTGTATSPSSTQVNLAGIPIQELPRGVDILRARRVRVYNSSCQPVGWRVKFTVAIPRRDVDRGLATPEWRRRIEEYNKPWPDEIPCPGGARRIDTTTGQLAPDPDEEKPAPFVGTILDFALHFEVKK